MSAKKTGKTWSLKWLFIIQLLIVLAIVTVNWLGRKDYATVQKIIQAGAEVRIAGTFEFGRHGDVALIEAESPPKHTVRVSADQVTGVFVFTDKWDKKQTLRNLRYLPNLELVYLEHRVLKKEDFKDLAALESVRMFELSGTGITEQDLMGLAMCRSLEVIKISNTAITQEAINDFNKLRPDVWVSKGR